MKNLKNLIIFMFVFLLGMVKVNGFTTAWEFHDCVTADALGVTGISSNLVCMLHADDDTQYYCLNKGLDITGGTVYNSLETITGKGIACGVLDAMNSGYIPTPTSDGKVYVSNFTRTSDVSNNYFKIQKLIWAKQNSTSTCSKTTSSSNTTTLTAGTLSATSPINLEKKVIDNNTYYVGVIPVTHSNLLDDNRYTVTSTLPTGIRIYVDSNYSSYVEQKTKADKLYIKIPAKSITKNAQYTINLSGSYNKEKVTTTTVEIVPFIDSYVAPNHTDQQHLGKPGLKRSSSSKDTYNTANLNAKVVLDVKPSGDLKIKKINEKTKKTIEGVKFKLYDATGKEAKDISGNLIGEKITDANGEITITNIPYGKYSIKETETPTGYIGIVNEEIEINSPTLEKTFTNNPIKTLISKKSIADEKELEGAHIVIKDEANNIVEEFDSTKEDHEVYLGPGKYSLIETASPEGYSKLETVFNFEIELNGNAKLLNTDSKYIKTEKNKITVYNEIEVPVPDTKASFSIIMTIIGLILASSGTALVILVMKKRKLNS